jgi:metallo-beta-lactamase class B
MIRQDVVVKDGDVIQLGGNSFGVLESPGHTVGTASYTFDVKDCANVYRAITIGGLGLNAIKSSQQVEGLIATLDRLSGLVKQANQPVTVNLAPHPFSSGLTESQYRLAERKPGEPHLLVDPDGFLKLLANWRSGAEQRLEIERKAGR